MNRQGGAVFVAHLDECPVAFIHGTRIEDALWGAQGSRLMFLACIVVPSEQARHGIGRRLVAVLEARARTSNMCGIAVCAYANAGGDQVDAYMPAAFFQHLGYETVATRGSQVLVWKSFTPSACPPRFLPRSYKFEPVAGRVVVDLFTGPLCPPSCLEAESVRAICKSYDNRVLLREYATDDPAVLKKYGVPRDVFVNGVMAGGDGRRVTAESFTRRIQEELALLDNTVERET